MSTAFCVSSWLALSAVLAANEPALPSNTPAPGQKAPFHVLFSNDTTNIMTCISPYHKARESWRPEMLQATVDEVAHRGVEVHMIQLGLGKVPWYRSKVYSMADHRAWWKSYYGVEPWPLGQQRIEQYILDGGDPMQVFIDECRKTGQRPFISLRLNDAHHLENVDNPHNLAGIASICRFYVEHKEQRVGPNLKNWNDRSLNWVYPEIPDHMFSLIREQCENYDIDGFELDFMRNPCYFRLNETTSAQRKAIMTGFVRRVRELLDRTAKPGQHRWLCVRVPCFLKTHDDLGLDLPAMVAAGVEMVNLSPYYFTIQQTDMAEIRKSVPTASVYLEMCHTTRTGTKAKAAKSRYDNFTFRRTTPQQYYTAAHLAYARGLDGVSAFNFVYYRQHGSGERGPFNEPPFEVFEHLGDRAWLAQQPQHYILAPKMWPAASPPSPLEPVFKAGHSATVSLDMAPPAGGWKKGGRLRIQGFKDLGDSQWQATLNGTALQETADRSEPYTTKYPPLLGDAADHRAWIVPAHALKDGKNALELKMTAGREPASIVFVDLALQ